MATTMLGALQDQVTSAREALAQFERMLRLNEQVARMVDERPRQDLETSVGIWSWRDSFTLTIYYAVPSIKEMADVIEYFETRFNVEATSYDNDLGVRVFSFSVCEFDLDIKLCVTPLEDLPEATCRKVLVGMDRTTEVRETPRYKLVCD